MKNNIPLRSTNKLETLKYTIIKSDAQYNEYCRILEELVEKDISKAIEDEIDLLTLLIEKWDEENNTFEASDPIELLKYLMEENNLKAKDLTEILHVSKGLVSDILNYKKGLSKDLIRSLSDRFKVSQEAFNRSYPLRTASRALHE
jgi:HTH-type transcriptional regulator/antitoxin HigA